jgi:non-heme chloroperoxidase
MLRKLLALAFVPGLATSFAAASRASHHVSFVSVAPEVHLEVLDWGGRGPALVFLAGFGNTGHVFDGFAPQFADHYHVFAITRRGFGVSSRPLAGYDSGTLTHDILAVLDSLSIRRASFVGHSFAGSELDFLGAYHPERVTTLVYLDASYDFAHLYGDPRWQRAFPIPRPPAPPTRNIPLLRRWLADVMGPDVPDDEVRNLTSNGAVAGLDKALQRGAYPTALAHIKAPVLAFWAAPRSVRDWYPYRASLDSLERSRLDQSFEDQMAVRREHIQMFGEQIRGARLVRVAGARHYLFLTHPRQIADAMRAFLTSVAPQSNDR